MELTYPQASRWQPDGPAWAYRTYRMLSPMSHRRPATCEEVECKWWMNGWTSLLDVSDPKQAGQANWIRLHSKRHFTVTQDGTCVTFTFQPGQNCFNKHTIPYKPHLFLVQGGDWRGNPRSVPVVRHSGVQAWVDDFAENQQAIKDRVGRG